MRELGKYGYYPELREVPKIKRETFSIKPLEGNHPVVCENTCTRTFLIPSLNLGGPNKEAPNLKERIRGKLFG